MKARNNAAVSRERQYYEEILFGGSGAARTGQKRRGSPSQASTLEGAQPGTGNPLHTQEPVTVASFRTWRGWRENVARGRCLTLHSSIGCWPLRL